MKAILTFLKSAFAGLSFLNRGTGSSSPVGSEGSSGNGAQSNGWSTVVIIVLLLGVGFTLGFFVHTPKVISTQEVVYKPGIPDTVRIPVPVTAGNSKPEQSHTVYTAELEPITIIAMPDYVETEVTIDEPGVSGNIRATAYPYVENDSLKIDLPIEWNIKPRPIEQITRIDTIPVPVPVPADVAWIEKPTTVVGATSLFWLAIIIFL